MNPLFTNPLNFDFSLQETSTCRNAGKLNYDLGAIYYDDIPASVPFMELVESSESGDLTIRWVNPSLTVKGNPLTGINSIQIFRNEVLIAEIFNPAESIADTLEYTDQIDIPEYFRYSICVLNSSLQMGQMQYYAELWLGGLIEGIVIFDLDETPITGSALQSSLTTLNYTKPVYLAQNSAQYPLEQTLDAVFVCLGIYSNNHVLTDGDAEILRDYLLQGGNLYMEGGDTWYFDPQTVLHPMFNILPVADGTSDMNTVLGAAGTFTEGMTFSYVGENNWMDHINPIAPAYTLFSNQSPAYNCAVAYNEGNYRTIGTSFELGGLVDGNPPSTKTILLDEILDFFNVIIPVELTSFTATVTGNTVTLNWTTATELNNSGFEVQRSDDVGLWQKIGFVKGHGTTSEEQNYTFKDNSVAPGQYQYRLKQIDFDGTFEFSEVVEIEVGLPLEFSLEQNYPNPFNPTTTIRFSIPLLGGDERGGLVTLKVYDVLGNEIATLVNEEKPAGAYEIEFDGTGLPSGIYFYKLKAGNFVETKKMVFLK